MISTSNLSEMQKSLSSLQQPERQAYDIERRMNPALDSISSGSNFKQFFNSFIKLKEYLSAINLLDQIQGSSVDLSTLREELQQNISNEYDRYISTPDPVTKQVKSSDSADLRKQLSDVTTRYMNLRKDYEKLTPKQPSEDPSMDKLMTDYEFMKSESDKLKTKYADLQSRYDADVAKFQEDRSNYEARINELNSTKWKVQEDAQHFAQRVEFTESRIRASPEYLQLQNKFNSLKLDKESLQGQISMLKAEFQNEIDSLHSSNATLEETNTMLQSENRKYLSTIQSLKTRKPDVSAELANENARLNGLVLSLQEQLDGDGSQLQSLKKENDSLKSSNSALRQDITEYQKLIGQRVQQSHASLTSIDTSLEEENQKLKSKILHLTELLDLLTNMKH